MGADAGAQVVERVGEEGRTLISVPDTAAALGPLAANFYDHPSREMIVVGVTGTNGKTTVTTLLYQLFTALGYTTGLLSTVEVRIGEQRQAATHTTPDALAIQRTLAEMRDAGCDYVFMEISSHAVEQRRIAGLHLRGAVFTNLSHDHLDYHGTFANYLRAKQKLFDGLPKTAFALTNVDDKRGDIMVQNSRARVYRYSLRRVTADYHARLIGDTAQGLQLEINGTEFHARLLGRFNAYNLLACYGVATLLEEEPEDVLVALSQLSGPAGRLQQVPDPTGRLTAVVDYAHTPDALENVLTTLNGLLAAPAHVVTVVGAGGDRDRSKRPEMARIAAQLSGQVVLTSDNPRSEDPEVILDEMEAGVPPTHSTRVLRNSNRRSAIQTAIRLARPGDIVLVAGKGHEDYQEINGERRPFSDAAELANALNAPSHAS